MLLAKSGWLRELASLKHPSAETPDFAAMLGAVKGPNVKGNCNCNCNPENQRQWQNPAAIANPTRRAFRHYY
ncbi:hypothetical protein GCM10010970_29790 [Silvimonas iriomotensis]|uniref:Uncharacterized protein n=1 Tax=Silvimonas iriomotensis TaxID=449662 RepID=A0ABQ2PCN8_9NEIS|nr:hypothetical protein GCM10010970_29790 [Silvimonas iriomotensis]